MLFQRYKKRKQFTTYGLYLEGLNGCKCYFKDTKNVSNSQPFMSLTARTAGCKCYFKDTKNVSNSQQLRGCLSF